MKKNTARLLRLTLIFLMVISATLSVQKTTAFQSESAPSIKIWDPATGREIQTLLGETNVTSVAYSPDGKFLAAGNGDRTISLRDARTGSTIATVAPHTGAVQSVAFSPDSQLLASGSWDRTIKIWRLSPIEELATLVGHQEVVLTVRFSSDGRLLASGSGDRTIKIWDVSTGKVLFTLEGHVRNVTSVAFSPDNSVLASASDDRTIRLWNAITGMRMFTLSGHQDSVQSIAFSLDNKYLVSGSRDQTVRVWDVSSGVEIRTLKGHFSGVTSVVFSPDSATVASASYDQTVRIWDVASGKRLRTLKGHGQRVTSVAYSPDGRSLVSGSASSPRETPTLHVIAIGIGNYPSAKRNLKFAAKDAQDFGRALERLASTSFSKVSNHTVIDEGATRAGIEAAFNRIIVEAKPEDTFVFFYTGKNVEGKGDARTESQIFLTPSDVDPDEKRQVIAAGLSTGLLQVWLTKIEARHQFIILNTGESYRGVKRFLDKIEKENKLLGPLFQRDMTVVAVQGRDPEPVSKENGFLVDTLLKALSGEVIMSTEGSKRGFTQGGPNPRGEITAIRVTDYVRAAAAEAREDLLRDRNISFTFYVTGGDFKLGVSTKSANKTKKNHHAAQPTVLASRPTEALREMQQESPPPAKTQVIRTGKDYALLIATNDYAQWNRLDNPLVDARSIEKELRDYYGFQTEVIENPKRETILRALLRYMREIHYSANDQLFIFFAGHGTFNEDFKEGYIVARDSKRDDELGDSYISHSQLRKIIDNIPCKHIFLVIDACFSGTIDEFVAKNRGSEDPLDSTNAEFIERIMEFKTRRFLTSGGKEYVPEGRSGQHSPFARRLLEALRSYGGGSGVLTITGILSRVERAVPLPRRGEWGGNQPGSDFVFIARKPGKK